MPWRGGPTLRRGSRMPRRDALTAGLAVLLAGALAGFAGCAGGGGQATATGGAGGGEVGSPLADCQGLDEPPGPAASTGAEPAAGTGAGEGSARLPELTLPCFTGGEPFALADLRGPAVVNLWASWCPPCREELPALQRFADRVGGRLHVLGVVTDDDRPGAAASLASDLGITFPALADRDAKLRAGLAGTGLPVTLLIDADGWIRHLHLEPGLDEETLAGLVTDHLGVTP